MTVENLSDTAPACALLAPNLQPGDQRKSGGDLLEYIDLIGFNGIEWDLINGI